MVMDNSQSLYITIKKEIELLDLFIKMERERTETNFDYSFEIETKELESKAIPPMILLPYVENAIIHGLIRLEREGNICIKIAEKNEQLICEIRDNGVGRNSDNSVDTSETRGETTIRPGKISISENRLSLYKELEGIDFDIETIDLKTKNGVASGTVVRVTLPSMKV
jgi:LytS/YehU family sensor histidine kinase